MFLRLLFLSTEKQVFIINSKYVITNIFTMNNIGDGDSSVMKRLKEIMPYGYSCVVQKVECRNHLLRNYCQKIMALTKKTEYPIHIRNFIANNAMRFRTAITKSISHYKNADGPVSVKINGLLSKKMILIII